MKCAKIIDWGHVYDSFDRIHREHGDISKFEDEYCPEDGMCGQVIWEGRDGLINENLAIIALQNNKNVAIGEDGIKVICNKTCESRRSGSCVLCKDN